MNMKILESPLMGAFIAYMMANWSRRSRVDQSRRRLRHLVAMVRAVADEAEVRAGAAAVRDDSFSTWLRLLRNEALRGQEALDATAAAAVAGSARRFLAGLRDLFGRSDEMDRLEEAVEELERLAEPGGALDRLSNVFGQRGAALDRLSNVFGQRGAARATDMDDDGGTPVAGARDEARGRAESVVPSAKRKRACCSGVDPGSTSHGVVDAAERRKQRRVLPSMRHRAGSGGGFPAAPRAPPPQPGSYNPEERARTVALAMARVRRRVGRSTTGRRRQAILGHHFSRFSLHLTDDQAS